MLQEGKNAKQGKSRNGEAVTVLNLGLRICPIDKEEFEQRLQKHRGGSIWNGWRGRGIASGHKEPSAAKVQ